MARDFVEEAIKRYKLEGTKGIDWVYFMSMTPRDKEDFDNFLVEIKHPLAYEPGTNEYRFKSFIKGIA